MATGIEITAVAKVLSPLMGELVKGAKDGLKKSFKKWTLNNSAQTLAKKFAAADKVKTIWSPDKEISLTSFYHPAQVQIGEQDRADVKSLSDLGKGNVVVEGIVGQGKSIFLRHLSLQELNGNGSARIPIFIELRSLAVGKSLFPQIQDALDKLNLCHDDSLFEYLAESGRIVLLLDGFDELEESLVSTTISELEYLIEKFDALQIVITSRPRNEIQKSRHFRVIKLASLEKAEFSKFLSKLNLGSTRITEIVRAIGASPSKVSELINTPLMLTLLVMVYETEQQIPSELPEFFERLFQTVFSRHDRLKAGFYRKHHSGLSERKLQQLFEVFCFLVVQKRLSRSLTQEQFAQVFDAAIKYVPASSCEMEKFRDDITKVSCLMLEEGLGLTTFLHKSIVEYFAAAFIKNSPDSVASLFYEKARTNFEPWREVVIFLNRIDVYRHAKYLVKPSAETFLKEINGKPTGASDSDILAFLKNCYPTFGVTYEPIKKDIVLESGTDQFRASRFGTYKEGVFPIAHLFEILTNKLVMSISGTCPAEPVRAEMLSVPNAFIRDGNNYIISLKNIVRDYPLVSVLKDFRALEMLVERSLREANKLIDQEDAKMQIFSANSII